jgi:hypothetical protein
MVIMWPVNYLPHIKNSFYSHGDDRVVVSNQKKSSIQFHIHPIHGDDILHPYPAQWMKQPPIGWSMKSEMFP